MQRRKTQSDLDPSQKEFSPECLYGSSMMPTRRRPPLCGSPGAALLLALGLDFIAVAGCGAAAARMTPRSSELCAVHPTFCEREALSAHHEKPGSSATHGGQWHSRLCLRGGGYAYPPRILAGKDLEMLRGIRNQEFEDLERAVLARAKAAKRKHPKQAKREWQVNTCSPTRFLHQQRQLLQLLCSQTPSW